uniref:Putative secreted protein n=1 Tax=Panstrongylus lignarius TaxID=156445 RepID=A0A224XY34_9HEMI
MFQIKMIFLFIFYHICGRWLPSAACLRRVTTILCPGVVHLQVLPRCSRSGFSSSDSSSPLKRVRVLYVQVPSCYSKSKSSSDGSTRRVPRRQPLSPSPLDTARPPASSPPPSHSRRHLIETRPVGVEVLDTRITVPFRIPGGIPNESSSACDRGDQTPHSVLPWRPLLSLWGGRTWQ